MHGTKRKVSDDNNAERWEGLEQLILQIPRLSSVHFQDEARIAPVAFWTVLASC